MKRKEAIKQLISLQKYCNDQIRINPNKVYWMKNAKAMEIALNDVKEESLGFWRAFILGTIIWFGFCYLAINIFY